MNKALPVCFSIVSLFLCSCNGTEVLSSKRYEIKLNKNNYWEYLDISGNLDVSANETVSRGVYKNVSCTIEGVLNFAYYENVIVTMDYYIYDSNKEYHNADVVIELNASGSAFKELQYTFLPENAEPKFDSQTTNLANYNRKLSLKDITGMIYFSI